MVNFESNMPLVTNTYKKYFSRLSRYKDDLMQCGYIGLWQACNKFDESKGYNFSTFAVRCIKNEMAQFLRKELKHWYYCTDYVITNEEGDKIDILEIFGDEKDIKDAEDKFFIDNALNVKNGHILKMYFNGDTLQQIGDKLGITHQAVSKIIKESRPKVRERIE